MGQFVRIMCLTVVTVGGLVAPSQAAIIEDGVLNIIDQVGNPFNGLRFFDMSVSVGDDLATGLADAQALFPNARLATPAEADALFTASSLTYDTSLVFSDGWTVGLSEDVSSGTNYNTSLRDFLGITYGTVTNIWTDPDGSTLDTTTRDIIQLAAGNAHLFNTSFEPINPNVGWLLVSEAPTSGVPEPSSAILLGFAAAVGCLAYRRRQATLVNQPEPNSD